MTTRLRAISRWQLNYLNDDDLATVRGRAGAMLQPIIAEMIQTAGSTIVDENLPDLFAAVLGADPELAELARDTTVRMEIADEVERVALDFIESLRTELEHLQQNLVAGRV